MRLVLPILLFATALHAQIALGPERLATAPRFDGTSIGAAATATDGATTLVVVQPGGPDGALYLQRLGGEAETLTAHGVPIARGVAALGGIASNRSGYVVVYTTTAGIAAIAIGTNGEVSAPHVAVATNAIVNWLRIASNGSGYLAAWSETTATTQQQAMAVRLDGGGNALGAPFALSDRRQTAGILALESDGRDYLAAIDRLDGAAVKTTLVPVSANGVAGANADLPLFLRTIVHTANGYIGLVEDNTTTKAMPVDADGHLGAPAIVSSDAFESAASNGIDALAISSKLYYPRNATRIRRNGDAIETIEHLTLKTQVFTSVAAGSTHAGRYFTMSLSAPAGVAAVASPPLDEHPLLTFATTQQAPAIAADGDLRVIAWREGSLVRAARLRGDTTLDAVGLDVANAALSDQTTLVGYRPPIKHALAVNAGRALIAWTELGYNGSEFPGLMPVRVVARILAADGTLARAVTIGSISGMETALDFAGVVATPSGFSVLFGYGSLHAASVDLNGNVTGVTTLDVPGGAPDGAMVRRADGFLLIYSEPPKNVLTAAPYHADGTPAGPHQIVSGSLDRQNFPAIAADGSGHFLVVWMENDRWMARIVDESGAPLGTARDFGTGTGMSVTWNDSVYAAVSGASMALIAADGRVLVPLSPALPPRAQSTVLSGDTMVTLHSGIDAGVGDAPVVFVRRFGVERQRAARH